DEADDPLDLLRDVHVTAGSRLDPADVDDVRALPGDEVDALHRLVLGEGGPLVVEGVRGAVHDRHDEHRGVLEAVPTESHAATPGYPTASTAGGRWASGTGRARQPPSRVNWCSACAAGTPAASPPQRARTTASSSAAITARSWSCWWRWARAPRSTWAMAPSPWAVKVSTREAISTP